MSASIFITGASGFVGEAVVRDLRRRDYPVVALVHRTSPVAADGVREVRADLFDTGALAGAMAGCEAVIHLVGIIMERPRDGVTFERVHVEATRSVVSAARAAGVRRYLHMSAAGTRPDAPSTYHRTKFAAEEIVRQSGLDGTIFRPSLIHGPRGEFMRQEAAWARKAAPPYLFMPHFGRGLLGTGGAGLLQPVFVDDVARAFVDALGNPRTVGQTYELGGAEQLTLPQLHQTVAQAVVGHRRWVMAIPAWKAKLLTYLIPARLLPFNWDQVIMSQEDNTADLTALERDFGWRPAGFGASFQSYARDL